MQDYLPTGLVKFNSFVAYTKEYKKANPHDTRGGIMMTFQVQIRTWKKQGGEWYPVLGTNHPKTNGIYGKRLADRVCQAFDTACDTTRKVSRRVYVKDQGFTTLAVQTIGISANGEIDLIPLVVSNKKVFKARRGSPTRLEACDPVDIRAKHLDHLLEH
jgi:hypothetical protein